MSKPLLLFTAPVGTRSGYGAHSRDIARSLIAMDKFDIKIFPVRWGSTPQNALNEKDPNDIEIIKRLLVNPNMERQPDVHIHCVVPNEFMTIGKYNIGITAGIETTACPQDWIEGLNRMDLNIVPSNFSKEALEKTIYDRIDNNTKQVLGNIRCEKPIEVLFEGADTKIYKKPKQISKDLKKEFQQIDESFLFLYVGHWLNGSIGNDRKDTGMLVKVFLETFKNHKKKPALLMKTNSADFSVLDREEMLKRIKDIKNSVKGDDLPTGLDLCVFDFGINAGPGRAAKFLQKMIGTTVDGGIGPMTLAKVNEFVGDNGLAESIKQYQSARQEYYENLSTFATFGKGWTRRVNETTEIALEL